MLIHSVYFYLKPELTAEQREGFRQELAKLGELPQVKLFHLGTPAGVAARLVVDLSFSFSITCGFENVAAHDEYQAHPVHVEFVARCRDLWSRLQVYDSEG